jgi:hypothetical protein
MRDIDVRGIGELVTCMDLHGDLTVTTESGVLTPTHPLLPLTRLSLGLPAQCRFHTAVISQPLLLRCNRDQQIFKRENFMLQS